MLFDITEEEYKNIQKSRKESEENKKKLVFYHSVITAFREAGGHVTKEIIDEMSMEDFIRRCWCNHLVLRYENPNKEKKTCNNCSDEVYLCPTCIDYCNYKSK